VSPQGSQRFELPFAGFQPREAGAKVDWSRVKVIPVALIHPNRPKRGSLFVDELPSSLVR